MTNVPAGKAVIETGVYDKTAKGVKAIQQRFKRMQSRIRQYSQKAALAAASIGAPLVLAAKQFADMGDSLNKASIRTRIQVAELAKLRFAAEQSGVSAKGLEDAIFRMDRRIGNAATGTGPAVRALRELKLEAGELSKATPDKKLEILMEALGGVANESVRNQLGFELFGDNFRELVPLLDAGAGSLSKLKKEAEETGIAFTGINATEEAANAAKLSDAMNKLYKQFQAIAVSAGSALAPALTKVAEDFTPILKSSLEFLANNKQMVVEVGKLAAVLGTLSIAMRALALVNPFAATIAGIALAVKNLDKFKSTVEYLVSLASGLSEDEKKDAPGLRGLINSESFKKTRESVRANEGIDKARASGDSKAFAEALLAKSDKATREASQQKASERFKSGASGLNSLIKNAAKSVSNIAKNVPQIAAGGLNAAGNFLQAQSLTPSLMASTAGGLGAGGALGIGATKGPTNPIQDVSAHTNKISETVEEMKTQFNDLLANGLGVFVENTQELKNG